MDLFSWVDIASCSSLYLEERSFRRERELRLTHSHEATYYTFTLVLATLFAFAMTRDPTTTEVSTSKCGSVNQVELVDISSP